MLDKIDWSKIEEAFLEKFVPYDGDPHPAYEYQISEKDGRNIFTNFFKSEIEKQVKEISTNVPVMKSVCEHPEDKWEHSEFHSRGICGACGKVL